MKYFLILLSFVFSVSSFAQINKSDIDKAINISSLKHPYLYFTDEEKPAMLERIKSDPESKLIFEQLQAKCNMYYYMPVDKNIPTQGKNTRAGWTENDRNGKYEEFYRTNLNNAYELAFLYQMTGDQRYAEKAFEFADAFCDLTTWTVRAHEFPVIYSRIMPWNVPDDQVSFTFDHMSGDSGRTMAVIYDWLYSGLTRAQRDRIRGALLEKVVTRVRGNYEFHWWATAYRCNWCGVCNSGVGLAGLTLLTENPQLTDIVAEAYNRINLMFNELDESGGWQEGGGYWNYALHTSTFFADALNRITKSKYNLFQNERLKNHPVNFPIFISIPGGGSLNFEDSGSSARYLGSPHMINKLATETKSAEAAWYRKDFLGEGDDIFDIIWPRSDVKPKAPESPSILFKTINWWVMRSDFKSPEKVMVAGKAGMNDDPHHGHLDIGHIVLYWQNEAFIRDLGSIGYDEKYFDDMRFDYPQTSSIGHNVVFVNDEIQIPGKLRKQKYNYEVGGKVEEFKSSDKYDYVIMNPTNAYPKKELQQWKRHVLLDKPEITLVVDEITAKPGSKIDVRFHPGVTASFDEGFVFLEGKKGNMVLIPLTNDKNRIIPGKHPSQYVNATFKFAWIDFFDTEVISTDSKTVISTLIMPAKNREEAKQIVSSKTMSMDKSGNMTVSFTKKGEIHSYSFENKNKELVLKKF